MKRASQGELYQHKKRQKREDVVSKIITAIENDLPLELEALLIRYGDYILSEKLTEKKLPLLHFAAEKNAVYCFKYLVENTPQNLDIRNDGDGSTSFHYAARSGSMKVCEYLVKEGKVDINISTFAGRTPLWCALQGNHLELAKLLLNAGADIEAKINEGETPLLNAAFFGYKDVAELLLNAGANKEAINHEGETPLLNAAFLGYKDVMKLLLNAGAAIDTKNNKGETPLLRAAFLGCTDVVKLLLEANANIEAKDNKGEAPLLRAAGKNQTKVAELLIKAGADIETKNNNGETPLLKATKKNHIKFAELLLNAGADIEARANDGLTPLWMAIEEGHTDGVRLLLNSGADIHAKINDGRNLLFSLCSSGKELFIPTMSLLLERGISTEAQDARGDTPIRYAGHNKLIPQLNLLIKYGANIDLNGLAEKGYITEVEDTLFIAGAVQKLLNMESAVLTLEQINKFNHLWINNFSDHDLVKNMINHYLFKNLCVSDYFKYPQEFENSCIKVLSQEASSKLHQYLKEWQDDYKKIDNLESELLFLEKGTTYVSYLELVEFCKELNLSVNVKNYDDVLLNETIARFVPSEKEYNVGDTLCRLMKINKNITLGEQQIEIPLINYLLLKGNNDTILSLIQKIKIFPSIAIKNFCTQVLNYHYQIISNTELKKAIDADALLQEMVVANIIDNTGQNDMDNSNSNDDELNLNSVIMGDRDSTAFEEL